MTAVDRGGGAGKRAANQNPVDAIVVELARDFGGKPCGGIESVERGDARVLMAGLGPCIPEARLLQQILVRVAAGGAVEIADDDKWCGAGDRVELAVKDF